MVVPSSGHGHRCCLMLWEGVGSLYSRHPRERCQVHVRCHRTEYLSPLDETPHGSKAPRPSGGSPVASPVGLQPAGRARHGAPACSTTVQTSHQPEDGGQIHLGSIPGGSKSWSPLSLWTLVLNWELLKTEPTEITTSKPLHVNQVFYPSAGVYVLACYPNKSGSQHTAEEKKWPGRVVAVGSF